MDLPTCVQCGIAVWSLKDKDNVRTCLGCGHPSYFAEEEKTVPIKNTDNKICRFCGKDTAPLFNTERYCPDCEKDNLPKKKKTKLQLDLDDLEKQLELFDGDDPKIYDYTESPCETCGDLSCGGSCVRFM